MRARPLPGSAEIVFSIRRELAVVGAGDSVGAGVVVGCASPGRVMVGRGARLVTSAVRPSNTANRTSSRRPSTRTMLAVCTKWLSAGVKPRLWRADTGHARTKVLKANRPRGRDAKPRSSGRVSRAATRSIRPKGLRDQGPGDVSSTGPTIPSGGFTSMLYKLRSRIQDEKGFTLIE